LSLLSYFFIIFIFFLIYIFLYTNIIHHYSHNILKAAQSGTDLGHPSVNTTSFNPQRCVKRPLYPALAAFVGEPRLRRAVPRAKRDDALPESRWPERHVALPVGFRRHPVRAAGAHAAVRLAQHQLGRLSRKKGELAHLLGETCLHLRGDNKQGNPPREFFFFNSWSIASLLNTYTIGFISFRRRGSIVKRIKRRTRLKVTFAKS